MRIDPQTAIDSVDLSDTVIGQARRADVREHPLNFRTAHCFLFNSEGALLLQKLGDPLHRHRGRLGSSAATFVHAGENYGDAVRRALREELGLTALEPVLMFLCPIVENTGTKFTALFQARHNGAITPDREHIMETFWMQPDRIAEDIESDPSAFTPTFRHLCARTRNAESDA